MLQKAVCIHHVFIYHMRCANNVGTLRALFDLLVCAACRANTPPA
jgi:hypothetical protein